MHFIFGLAVNHHFNEMEVAQSEHFIMKKCKMQIYLLPK